jgi:hypothetical protein
MILVSRRRLVKVIVALLIVLCLATLVWFQCVMPAIRSYQLWSDAGWNIANNGGAVMKDGTVLIIPRKDFEQKDFGDRQLSAIIPSLPLVRVDSLGLHGTSVTDGGIARLATSNEIQWLDVSDTPVTVTGLLALQHLPKLNGFTVSPGQLSQDDVQTLCSAFQRKVRLRMDSRSPPQTNLSETSPGMLPGSTIDHDE